MADTFLGFYRFARKSRSVIDYHFPVVERGCNRRFSYFIYNSPRAEKEGPGRDVSLPARSCRHLHVNRVPVRGFTLLADLSVKEGEVSIS